MIGSKIQSNHISKFLQIRSGIERDQFLPLNYWGITAQLWKRPQYIQIQKLLIKRLLQQSEQQAHVPWRWNTFFWSLNFTAELMKMILIRNCSTEFWTPLHFIYKYIFSCYWFWVTLKENIHCAQAYAWKKTSAADVLNSS